MKPTVVVKEFCKIAHANDVDDILALIIELSNWLQTKGIRQWSSSFPRERIAADVQAGFVHVVRHEESLVATVTLTSLRDSYWEDFPGEAIYLHKLAVSRSSSGKNMGSRLLAWAEDYVKKSGHSLLRLDCDSQNPTLRRYYEKQDYEFRGLRRFEPYNMEFALYEKRL